MAEPASSGSDERQPECSSGGSRTETIDVDPEQDAVPILHLRLNPPRNEHKVKWSDDTVDNEFMGKKKSKCCCIYEKPKVFGESSSSDDEDGDDSCTDHCKGHKKKCYRKKPHQHAGQNHNFDTDAHDANPGQEGTSKEV